MSKPRSKDLETLCPYCDSDSGSQVLLTPINLIRMAVNAVTGFIFLALAVVMAVVLDDPSLSEVVGEIQKAMTMSLSRRCMNCKGKFLAKTFLGREPVCGNCDYDLTGNVSGICPEFGWKLTKRMKRRVRMKMKLDERRAKRKTKGGQFFGLTSLEREWEVQALTASTS